MEQEQSKWAAISGALDCSRTQWYAWQGTYSSIFFMALMPAIWGEQSVGYSHSLFQYIII